MMAQMPRWRPESQLSSGLNSSPASAVVAVLGMNQYIRDLSLSFSLLLLYLPFSLHSCIPLSSLSATVFHWSVSHYALPLHVQQPFRKWLRDTNLICAELCIRPFDSPLLGPTGHDLRIRHNNAHQKGLQCPPKGKHGHDKGFQGGCSWSSIKNNIPFLKIVAYQTFAHTL